MIFMITGNGWVFCAGDDIAVLTMVQDPTDADDLKSSPVALRIIKETSSKILGDNLHHFWVSCQRFAREVARTDDFLEGATAFMEKRSPRFLGH